MSCPTRCRSLVVLPLLALVCSPLAVQAADEVKKYDSPQAVFDAGKAASAKENWPAFCAVLTPDSRDTLTGLMAMTGAMMEQLAGLGGAFGDGEATKEIEQRLAPIREVLDKHNVDTEAIQAKLKGQGAGAAFKDAKQLKVFASSVKDRTGFVADMMGAMKKLSDGKMDAPLNQDAKLIDVTQDGDAASGFVEMTKNGQLRKEPIQFQKIDGGWLIQLPMDAK